MGISLRFFFWGCGNAKIIHMTWQKLRIHKRKQNIFHFCFFWYDLYKHEYQGLSQTKEHHRIPFSLASILFSFQHSDLTSTDRPANFCSSELSDLIPSNAMAFAVASQIIRSERGGEEKAEVTSRCLRKCFRHFDFDV